MSDVLIRQWQVLGEAAHWLDVSLGQIERYVSGFAELANGDPEQRSATMVVADAHFLLNALAQAEKALRRQTGPRMSRMSTTIRSLRDVHEHWEQHKESFEAKSRSKTRSGKRLVDEHPDTIPWVFKHDATGTWISALRLEDVWDEVVDLRRDLDQSMRELTSQLGAVAPTELAERAFPDWASGALGISMVTQNIVLEPPTEAADV